MFRRGVEEAPAHQKYNPVKVGIEGVANVFAFNGKPLPSGVDLTEIPLYWHDFQGSYRLSRLIPSRNYQGTMWDLSIEQAPRNPKSHKTYQTAWTDHADFRLALSAHTERSGRETSPNFVQLLVAGVDGKNLVFNRTGAPPSFSVEDLLAKRRFRPEAVVEEVGVVLEAAKAHFLRDRGRQLGFIKNNEPQGAIIETISRRCNELVSWSKEKWGKKQKEPDKFLLWGHLPSREVDHMEARLPSINILFASSNPKDRENWQNPWTFSNQPASWTRVTDYTHVKGKPLPREIVTGSTDFASVQTSRKGELFQSEGQVTLYKHAPERSFYMAHPRTLWHRLNMGVQEVPYDQFDEQVATLTTASFLDSLRNRVDRHGIRLIIASSEDLQALGLAA